MKLLLLLISLSFLSFKIQQSEINQKENIVEFNKAVQQIEKAIWSQNGYIIDTMSDHWTAIDPKDFYSFEGDKRKSETDELVIKIHGHIYTSAYFNNLPKIKYQYMLRGKKKDIAELNCGSESLTPYPFKLKEVKAVYVEKIIHLPPSDKIVFDRMFFEERYVVTYKNNKVKTFSVDPISRTFFEVH